MNTCTIMQLLEEKVPLTLLLDLAGADRLESTSILHKEEADLSWLDRPHQGPATLAAGSSHS